MNSIADLINSPSRVQHDLFAFCVFFHCTEEKQQQRTTKVRRLYIMTHIAEKARRSQTRIDLMVTVFKGKTKMREEKLSLSRLNEEKYIDNK